MLVSHPQVTPWQWVLAVLNSMLRLRIAPEEIGATIGAYPDMPFDGNIIDGRAMRCSVLTLMGTSLMAVP